MCRYLENFRNITSRALEGTNRTEHVEEALRNPLAMFTLMYRFADFLRILNSLPDVYHPSG